VPDADGLVPAGSLSITASPNSGYSLGYWLVNGVKTGTAPASLSAHTFIRAVFNRAVTVNVFTDGAGSVTTPGTLRYALANAGDGDIITLSGVTAGTTTIELGSALPEISKSLTIEGNGVTLTRAAFWTNSSSLLSISGGTTEVLVQRLHFKDGLTTGNGGAVYNYGTLTLESCIFSGNRTTGNYGGAVYSQNTLTIRGCTFYGNTSSYYSGAVYFDGGILTLTGNLFYGNTAVSSHPVITPYGTVNTSYNVVDAAFGTGNTQAGWNAGTGDKTTLADSDDLTITGNPVNTTTFAPVAALQGVLPPAAPAGFPVTDFYGTSRTFPGAPGAVK
jgi:predicted outer membrane repeat protein